MSLQLRNNSKINQNYHCVPQALHADKTRCDCASRSSWGWSSLWIQAAVRGWFSHIPLFNFTPRLDSFASLLGLFPVFVCMLYTPAYDPKLQSHLQKRSPKRLRFSSAQCKHSASGQCNHFQSTQSARAAMYISRYAMMALELHVDRLVSFVIDSNAIFVWSRW